MALPMAIFINVLGPQNIDYSQWHSRVTEWQFSPSWSVLSIVYFVARMSASLEKTCHFKIPTRTRQNEHLFSRHYLLFIPGICRTGVVRLFPIGAPRQGSYQVRLRVP